jgi:murein DD-endopeptidase MepM/ murein hydrolase activator NlpD
MSLFSSLNHLTSPKIQMNYVFEPRRTTVSEVIGKFLCKRFHCPKLPSKIKGHYFSIESGLRPKSHSTFKSQLILTISLFIALPLIWGINSNSDASMVMETNSLTVNSSNELNTLIIPLNLPQVKPSSVFQKQLDCNTGEQAETFTVHCQINSRISLTDAQQTGLSKALVSQFIKIFQPTIDIEREKQIDDQFSLIYKQAGEKSEILAAEFFNKGTVYSAIRYTDKKTKTTDYYTLAGERLQKISLLSAPVKKITRISSPFGMRKHPILRKYKLHTGIDYAAVWGTPVFAGGDATVKFRGRKSGYGKVITLEHHKRVISLYAHLSKFAKNLKVGDKVKQGEIIGYIGKSGRATGPHLHYEIKVDNKPINPEQFAKSPLTLTIAKKHKAYFLKQSQALIAKLENLNQLSPTTIKLAQQ